MCSLDGCITFFGFYMMSTESSSMQYSQKFDQIIVPSIHFVFFLCVDSFNSTSVFQISISSYHMIDVVYQIMILLAGTPVLRTGQHAGTIVDHMIIHGTKRLVKLVTDGLSFKPFVG